MLFYFTVDKKYLPPSKVLNNEVKKDNLILRYDDDYKMSNKGDTFFFESYTHSFTLSNGVLTIPVQPYPEFQIYNYSGMSFGNFQDPKITSVAISPGAKVQVKFKGTRVDIYDSDTMYLPPLMQLGTVSIEEAAYEILKILKAQLKDFVNSNPVNPIMYFTRGLDTGVLKAIILKENLPIEISEKYTGQFLPGDKHKSAATYTQKFLRVKHLNFGNIPPEQNVSIVTGLYGGMETLRWPASMRSLFNVHGLNYDKLHKDNYNGYLGKFLDSPYHEASNTKRYPPHKANNLVEAAFACDTMLMSLVEAWSIPGTRLFSPFRHRDIHWWAAALRPADLIKQAFHSELHKEMIRQAYPKVLEEIDKVKV